MEEIRMLQSSAMGYGSVSWELVSKGLELEPHIIVGQGTSSDPGPAYLGADELYGYVGKANKKRDIALILRAAHEARIPFVFSGGSPSGSDIQLEGVLQIVNELCRENGWQFKIAVISGEVGRDYLLRRLAEGTRMPRLAPSSRLSPLLTEEDVLASKRIVAQMGPEPVMEALASGVDGVICGRALDVGLHMAFPLIHGFDRSVVAHMAKVMECGALCASPPLNDNVFARLRRDHFLIMPLHPGRRCTVSSVAAHTFYERPDVTREINPGGYLDLSNAQYVQIDERTTRGSGARWGNLPYTVKLEGVRFVGYRTISIAGIRDKRMVRSLRSLEAEVVARTATKFGRPEDVGYRVAFANLGLGAVLGPAEPSPDVLPTEAGIVITVVASSQDLAASVCSYVRGQLFFGEYPQRTSTSGNMAIFLSPADISIGPAYEWSVWHALPLDDPSEPFQGRLVGFPNDEFVDE